MAANREFYEQEILDIQEKISTYLAVFPATVRPEDGIVLAQDMEKNLEIDISSVGLGTLEFVASLNGNADESTDGSSNQTLSEQANASTKEQINEIEGVEDTDDEEAALQAALRAIEETGNPTLYRTQDTMQFNCTYDALKKTVKYLAAHSGRMTLNNISASYDSSTGNLSGSMAVNIFSMSGVNAVYQEPDAGSVAYGTDNIFGTIETPVGNPEEIEGEEGENAQDSSSEEQEEQEITGDESTGE
jgi:hypothetical protein